MKHVPKLMRNLVAVAKLNYEGHNVNFVVDCRKFIAQGNKSGTLYITSNCRDMVENGKKEVQSKG